MSSKKLKLEEEQQKPIEEQLADALTALKQAENDLDLATAENATLTNSIEALTSENVQLKSLLAKPNGQPLVSLKSLPNFEVDGEKYKFSCARFNIKGVMMTAADALSDETILEELVAINSGVITKVL